MFAEQKINPPRQMERLGFHVAKSPKANFPSQLTGS